jgi:hypothetical protein
MTTALKTRLGCDHVAEIFREAVFNFDLCSRKMLQRWDV